MLYLYLGFLLAQSISVAQVIYNANIPPLTIAFSIIVFLIWSFFPVLGYVAGYFIAAKRNVNKLILIVAGISISLLEQVLFHYDVLTYSSGYLATLTTACLFFIVAFLPLGPKKTSSI